MRQVISGHMIMGKVLVHPEDLWSGVLENGAVAGLS